MENLFDVIRKILEEYSSLIDNPNNISISYNFSTGMDEPEFKINGKRVDPELLRKFENSMQDFAPQFTFGNNFMTNQSFLNNSEAFRKKNSSEFANQNQDMPLKEIFYDIFDEGNKLKIIVELPGVNKNDIQLQADTSEIEITTPFHHKKIPLPVIVNNNIAKARYTNGILEIELEKIAKGKKKKKLEID